MKTPELNSIGLKVITDLQDRVFVERIAANLSGTIGFEFFGLARDIQSRSKSFSEGDLSFTEDYKTENLPKMSQIQYHMLLDGVLKNFRQKSQNALEEFSNEVKANQVDLFSSVASFIIDYYDNNIEFAKDGCSAILLFKLGKPFLKYVLNDPGINKQVFFKNLPLDIFTPVCWDYDTPDQSLLLWLVDQKNTEALQGLLENMSHDIPDRVDDQKRNILHKIALICREDVRHGQEIFDLIKDYAPALVDKQDNKNCTPDNLFQHGEPKPQSEPVAVADDFVPLPNVDIPAPLEAIELLQKQDANEVPYKLMEMRPAVISIKKYESLLKMIHMLAPLKNTWIKIEENIIAAQQDDWIANTVQQYQNFDFELNSVGPEFDRLRKDSALALIVGKIDLFLKPLITLDNLKYFFGEHSLIAQDVLLNLQEYIGMLLHLVHDKFGFEGAVKFFELNQPATDLVLNNDSILPTFEKIIFEKNDIQLYFYIIQHRLFQPEWIDSKWFAQFNLKMWTLEQCEYCLSQYCGEEKENNAHLKTLRKMVSEQFEALMINKKKEKKLRLNVCNAAFKLAQLKLSQAAKTKKLERKLESARKELHDYLEKNRHDAERSQLVRQTQAMPRAPSAKSLQDEQSSAGERASVNFASSTSSAENQEVLIKNFDKAVQRLKSLIQNTQFNQSLKFFNLYSTEDQSAFGDWKNPETQKTFLTMVRDGIGSLRSKIHALNKQKENIGRSSPPSPGAMVSLLLAHDNSQEQDTNKTIITLDEQLAAATQLERALALITPVERADNVDEVPGTQERTETSSVDSELAQVEAQQQKPQSQPQQYAYKPTMPRLVDGGDSDDDATTASTSPLLADQIVSPIEFESVDTPDTDALPSLHELTAAIYANNVKQLEAAINNLNTAAKAYWNEHKQHVEFAKFFQETINQKLGEHKETLLHRAIQQRCGLDIIELLYRNHIDLSATNKQNQTPLHLSCELETDAVLVKLCEWLRKPGSEYSSNVFNMQDHEGNTPLHKAAASTHKAQEKMQCLLNTGAKIQETNKAGNTVLHEIVRAGKEALVHFVRDRYLALNKVLANKAGDTVWHEAVRLKDKNTRHQMLRALKGICGACQANTLDKNTPLHLLCDQEKPDVTAIRLFLQELTDSKSFKEKNNRGKTVIDLAIESSSSQVLGLLLRHVRKHWKKDSGDLKSTLSKALKTIANLKGNRLDQMPAMIKACLRYMPVSFDMNQTLPQSQENLLQVLLKKVNVKQPNQAYVESIKLLLKHRRIDVNHLDKEHKTILQTTAKSGNVEGVQLILAHARRRMNVSYRVKSDRNSVPTALHYALENDVLKNRKPEDSMTQYFVHSGSHRRPKIVSNSDGKTPLMLAATFASDRQAETLGDLIKNFGSRLGLNVKGSKGQYLLNIALQNSNPNMFCAIVENAGKRLNVNRKLSFNSDKITVLDKLLTAAVKNGEINSTTQKKQLNALVKQLHLHVNRKTSALVGKTPAEYVVDKNRFDLLEILLKHKKLKVPHDVLNKAVRQKNANDLIPRLLQDHRLQHCLTLGNHGEAALNTAVTNEQWKAAAVLIDGGARVSDKVKQNIFKKLREEDLSGEQNPVLDVLAAYMLSHQSSRSEFQGLRGISLDNNLAALRKKALQTHLDRSGLSEENTGPDKHQKAIRENTLFKSIRDAILSNEVKTPAILNSKIEAVLQNPGRLSRPVLEELARPVYALTDDQVHQLEQSAHIRLKAHSSSSFFKPVSCFPRYEAGSDDEALRQ